MNTSYIPYRRLFYCLLAKIHQGRWRTEIGYCAHSPEIRSLCLIKWLSKIIQIFVKSFSRNFHEIDFTKKCLYNSRSIKFMFDKMTQRNDSNFVVFLWYENYQSIYFVVYNSVLLFSLNSECPSIAQNEKKTSIGFHILKIL